MYDFTTLLEGLAFVLLVLSIYLHFWGIKILRKYDIAGTKLMAVSVDIDTVMEIYRPSFEKWKEAIDKNLEMPISEHLFHAFFNTMVSLGASDIGKEGKAKQNLAIQGFQRIGRAIGKGVKKEIPAIESLSGVAGSAGPGAGGLDMLAGMFGVDLPPGAGALISQAMGPQQTSTKQQSNPNKDWKD